MIKKWWVFNLGQTFKLAALPLKKKKINKTASAPYAITSRQWLEHYKTKESEKQIRSKQFSKGKRTEIKTRKWKIKVPNVAITKKQIVPQHVLIMIQNSWTLCVHILYIDNAIEDANTGRSICSSDVKEAEGEDTNNTDSIDEYNKVHEYVIVLYNRNPFPGKLFEKTIMIMKYRP